MKILFYRYNSICEPDLEELFCSIGFTVETVDEEMTRKDITAEERIRLVQTKLESDVFSFVFSINFFPAISEICEIYKVKYVCWTIDSPVMELFDRAVMNDCNRLFLFDKSQYDIISQVTNRAQYLPLGTNVERWEVAIKNISDSDRGNYSSDISFVGNMYIEKDPYNTLLDKEVEIRGIFDRAVIDFESGKENFEIEEAMTDEEVDILKSRLPQFFYPGHNCIGEIDRFSAVSRIFSIHYSSLERIKYLKQLSQKFKVDLYTNNGVGELAKCNNLFCHKGVSTLTQMPKVFNLSKINLNMTIRSIEKGLPLRIWDIMGAGGFLMTDYKEELADIMVVGKECECYQSLDELVDKCDFYLKNEEIRRKIAISGYEKVKKYHAYINRMPAILASIMNQ